MGEAQRRLKVRHYSLLFLLDSEAHLRGQSYLYEIWLTNFTFCCVEKLEPNTLLMFCTICDVAIP